MMKRDFCFETATIRQIEEEIVRRGLCDGLSLMERAAAAFCRELTERKTVKGRRVAVAVGTGNNGGDGYAIARLLREAGAAVTVYAIGEPKTDSAREMKKRYPGEVVPFSGKEPLRADIVVDALLGIGTVGPVRAAMEEAIAAVNQSGAYVASVDVPSGLAADSAERPSGAVRADLCVSFFGYKKALLMFPAAANAGTVAVDSLGCGEEFLSEFPVQACICRQLTFPKREADTHKGNYGTAALVCGSAGMAGAAILSCDAALRSGAGLVRAVVPESVYPIVAGRVAEAVFDRYTSRKKSIYGALETACRKATAVLIGCGLSQGKNAERCLDFLLKNARVPLVIDADGINLLSRRIDSLRQLSEKVPVLLTPHPAEMARLCRKTVAEIERDRPKVAREFAETYHCTVILKGSKTVIAGENGEVWINVTGNPGMATGGSGDTLAGIAVSFLAQGMPVLQAGISAVYCHAAAGDAAAKQQGERGMLPRDLIGEIGRVCQSFEES